MAAVMGKHVLTTFANNLAKRRITRYQRITSVTYSTGNSQDESVSVDYPPIKPLYPPGKWPADLPRGVQWHMHKEAAVLNGIPNVKERLESMAGLKDRYLWKVKPLDEYSENALEYKQYITKTHIVKDLPDIHKSIDVESAYETLKPHLVAALLQENEFDLKSQQDEFRLGELKLKAYKRRRLVSSLVNVLLAGLSSEKEYLLRSQVDKGVRVETFWRRTGFKKDEDYRTTGQNFGIICLQSNHVADLQIRTELPLPEFVSMEDSICLEGHYPQINYDPKGVRQHYTKGRPTTVSGHWVGDPCEFGLVSFCSLSHDYDKFLYDYGEKRHLDHILAAGLTISFTSAAAQAHNQGFNTHWDLTYPFTTQTVISDGQWFRFFAYQLNTLHLWKDDECNPLRNILWASDEVKLYDVIENGEVKGLNDDVLKNIMRCILLEPRDRGVDLRPYLPDEEAPVNKKKYINHKGEEPFPRPVIGQFQYPPNSVYF